MLDIVGVVVVGVIGLLMALFGLGAWVLRDGPVLDSP